MEVCCYGFISNPVHHKRAILNLGKEFIHLLGHEIKHPQTKTVQLFFRKT